MCLVISLQNLGCPAHCVRDGPFSIADGNSWLQPLGVHLRKKNDTAKLFDGKYIVHDEHLKHFFALEVREGCFVQKDGENINTLTFGEVMNYLKDTRFTLFYLALGEAPIMSRE